MNDETKKRLTQFLGECWHHWIVAYPDDHTTNYAMRGHKCHYCGEYWPTQPKNPGPIVPRTFTTLPDMMALYRRLWETGKWEEFLSYVYDPTHKAVNYSVSWIICLSGEGYAERCEMVGKFLEEKP